MSYHNNMPLNNRSGLGGKERMQREEAVGAAREQVERSSKREEHIVDAERTHNKEEATEEKRELAQ